MFTAGVKVAIKLTIIVCIVANCFLTDVRPSLAQNNSAAKLTDPAVASGTHSLKGKIEEIENEERPEPNVPLQETNLLSGRAQADLKNGGYLKGNAQMGELDSAKEDPDADDKDLMIAWDRWRNRFLQAVLSSTSEMLNSDQVHSFQINPDTHNMESVYPVGTAAWFVCEVTKDRQIKRLRILNSSGYPDYDQAVLEAVQALQGLSILRFPTGSRRIAVLQGGAVERASRPKQQYFNFGDNEHYRVPSF